MQLKDKIAVVTGAASGIGREIARTFAREGASIAIADLDHAGARRTAAELERDGARAIALTVDVTSEAQVDAAMARVVESFGRIDVLAETCCPPSWVPYHRTACRLTRLTWPPLLVFGSARTAVARHQGSAAIIPPDAVRHYCLRRTTAPLLACAAASVSRTFVIPGGRFDVRCARRP